MCTTWIAQKNTLYLQSYAVIQHRGVLPIVKIYSVTLNFSTENRFTQIYNNSSKSTGIEIVSVIPQVRLTNISHVYRFRVWFSVYYVTVTYRALVVFRGTRFAELVIALGDLTIVPRLPGAFVTTVVIEMDISPSIGAIVILICGGAFLPNKRTEVIKKLEQWPKPETNAYIVHFSFLFGLSYLLLLRGVQITMGLLS